MADFIELTADQVRQSVDVEQAYGVHRAAAKELALRFLGSMSWKAVGGREYLYRKARGVWRSLGPRGPETELAHKAFHEGRERLRARLRTLATRLDEMAPVNRALRLGRVPRVAARILRGLDAAGLLGSGVELVGTNALFAYERMAGVQLSSGQLATRDIDLLYDSRMRLKLVASEVATSGVMGVLRKVDRSFATERAGSFRAANDDGYLVDLIKPSARQPSSDRSRNRIGTDPEDLAAIDIEGLVWLVNSPKVEAILVDERGYPLTVMVPDPRTFALHKLWLSQRADRDPAKRRRDEAQARMVALLVATRLTHLRFDQGLEMLPAALRARAGELRGQLADTSSGGLDPDW